MAEYCVKCNRKIGIFEDAALYLKGAKPICKGCAQPIIESFEKIHKCNADELFIEKENLLKICEDNFDVELTSLIIETFAERRSDMGLLSDKEKEDIDRQKVEFQEKVSNMPMTTTPNFEGYKIIKYIEVISEEIIFKNSFWKQLTAGLEDLGNAFSFKQTEMTGASDLISNAREYVLEKFKKKAARLGANAIVGVEFESSFGSDVVRVAIFGTAVIISEYESQ